MKVISAETQGKEERFIRLTLEQEQNKLISITIAPHIIERLETIHHGIVIYDKNLHTRTIMFENNLMRDNFLTFWNMVVCNSPSELRHKIHDKRDRLVSVVRFEPRDRSPRKKETK